MPFDFGPEYRLHYPWEYRRFFSGSQVLRLKDCTIFRIPNPLGHFRLGITIKARGGSVERNRVKRQIREAFRLHRDILGSFDYNVVISSQREMDFDRTHRLGRFLREELPREMVHFKSARERLPTTR